MKDPAVDLSLKHQPLEYYKCHLHTVLEKKKQMDRLYGDKGQLNEPKWLSSVWSGDVAALASIMPIQTDGVFQESRFWMKKKVFDN